MEAGETARTRSDLKDHGAGAVGSETPVTATTAEVDAGGRLAEAAGAGAGAGAAANCASPTGGWSASGDAAGKMMSCARERSRLQRASTRATPAPALTRRPHVNMAAAAPSCVFVKASPAE